MPARMYSSLKSYSIYSMESQIRELFEKNNIPIETQNAQEFNLYCPFHKNRNSPAFFINAKTGLWQCFNPSCGKKGNFRQLYREITGKPYGKDVRLDPIALKNEIERGFRNKVAVEELDISDISVDFESETDLPLLDPFINRGLSLDTLEYFEIGYSRVKDRIVIPVRAQDYKLVGFIGRAINEEQEPRYLYNKGFKRADVLFNIQNAKKYESCIVVEGSVDAMMVHQAGFPNVVSTLGAQVSQNQVKIMKRCFDSIIIFSDNDDAGIAMRNDIIDLCRGKEIYTVENNTGLKDPGAMTSMQIQEVINNKTHTI
jgi:DNA primase